MSLPKTFPFYYLAFVYPQLTQNWVNSSSTTIRKFEFLENEIEFESRYVFSVDLYIWIFFLDWNKLEFQVLFYYKWKYCFQTFSYKFKKLMNVCTYNNNLLHKIKLQTSENVSEVGITLLKCIQYTKTFTSIMYCCV